MFRILCITALMASATLNARVSVHIAPPPVIVETPAPPPGPGYVWAPGYYRWDGSAATGPRHMGGRALAPRTMGAATLGTSARRLDVCRWILALIARAGILPIVCGLWHVTCVVRVD